MVVISVVTAHKTGGKLVPSDPETVTYKARIPRSRTKRVWTSDAITGGAVKMTSFTRPSPWEKIETVCTAFKIVK